MSSPDPTTNRRSVYWLLITVAVGVAAGRIASAERVNEPSVHRADDDKSTPRPAWPRARPTPSPLFSSNDRSRWALIRALVDEGTFVIGQREYDAKGKYHDSGIIFEDGWQSVDKVLHPERLEFYSTKPPLLSVLVAGEYWLLQRLTGWTLRDDTFTVVRVLLVTTNLLPLVLYLWLLGRLADRFATTDWARYFILAAAGFATLLTPFLVTFNNHTIATTAVLVAVWAVVRILEGGGPWHHALAGLMAGFAACNELPALSLAAGLFVFLVWKFPRPALTFYLPAMLLPIGALLTLDYVQTGEVVPIYAKFGGPWYEYEGSHWKVPEGVKKRGIDFAGRNGETKATYAFHLLLGHHGLFLLMPITLLAFVGMALGLMRDRGPPTRLLSLYTLLLSVVLIGFYLFKSDNYGGWTNGPRWLMWLSPLWLLTMLPVLDWMARRRWARGVALLLLAWSMLSMNYQAWNAWRHPWPYNWMESRGWIEY